MGMQPYITDAIPEVDLEAVARLLGGLDADLALDEPGEEGAVGAAQ